MGPVKGFCGHFRQADHSNFAFADQFGHRTNRIFDRHFGIRTVHVIEVDDIGLKSF